MPHALAHSVEILTTVLTVAGMGYFLAAMVAARVFLSGGRAPLAAFAPGVSILKSLKGLDPGMIEAFRSHCRQLCRRVRTALRGFVAGRPGRGGRRAAQAEFPERSIRLIECPRAAGNQRQGQHAGSACHPRALRFSAHQRLRHHRLAPLPGTGDGPSLRRQFLQSKTRRCATRTPMSLQRTKLAW